jgi:long-chain acyl-CoA synthetase
MMETAFDNKPCFVHQFLEESARRSPGKTALISDEGRVSYGQIDALAENFAAFLTARGVRVGDHVVIMLRNSLEYVVSYYGTLKAGAVAVPLTSEIKPAGLNPLLAELEPAALISSHQFEKHLDECAAGLLTLKALAIKSPKNPRNSSVVDVHGWDDIVGHAHGGKTAVGINEDMLASIIYTSGSTGKPKGVMLTHRNIVTNTDSICRYLRLTERDIQMVVLPFHYVMGKSLLNTHFAVGGTVVLNNKFAYPASVIKQMIDERVTGFSGVPSTYAYLLHRSPLKNSRDKLEHLRYCSQAGGHMSRQIKKELRLTLPDHTDIFIMYGATEAAARLSYLEPSMFADKMDSIGKAVPNVIMKVLDEKGNELPNGVTGEIVASGPNIMQGYWKDSEASLKALDHNGYHTGDLGYRDGEGYFYLTGRKDNLLKVGGHRVNPQEIEDVLEETGLLIEAVVVGVPDKLLGDRLVAIAAPIGENCTEEQVLSRCADRLPRFKLPSSVCLVKSLPKNSSGKIDRARCDELLKAVAI